MPITNKKVRLFQGKPLLVGGKVAVSDNCCCGANTCPDCAVPAGDCVQVLCFKIQLDAAEVDYGGQGGSPFEFASYSLIPYYVVGDNPGWYFETPTNELIIPFDPNDIKDRLICFQLVLKYHSGTDQFESYLIIDGVQTDSVFDAGADVDNGSGTDRLQIGSKNAFGNPTHRSIFAPTILTSDTAQFPAGTVFQFPSDSFTSTSGTTITFIGDEIRIDTSATSSSVYAQKDFSPFYHLTCNVGACCDGETCTTATEAGCAATWMGAGTDCDPNPCCLDTKTVSLSGITFCTDCIFLALNHGFKISDDTIISGSPWTVSGGSLISHGCIACGWDSLSLVTQPNIKVHDYANGACTGSPTDFDDAPIIIAARIDGLYYCFVYAGYSGTLFFLFYGSSSDPSSISNSLSGCATTITINDRFTDCVFGSGTPGSGSQVGQVMGTGGTASIS